jgi:acylglycerol lipase
VIDLPRYTESYVDLENKTRVFHRCWFSDKYNVLVVGVHGFVEHGGRYVPLGETLSHLNYAFCIHDLRGHGKTASDNDKGFIHEFEDFLNDLYCYIKYIKESYRGDKTFLFGHSMGGLITVYYAGYTKRLIDGIITSGAAVYLGRTPLAQKILLTTLSRIYPRKRIKLPIKAEDLTNINDVNSNYVRDSLVIKDPTVRLIVELYNASLKVWKYVNNIYVPALIMHGKKDRIVPPQASIMLYEKIPSTDKKLVLFENSKHELINDLEKEKVIEEIISWLSRHT